MSFWTAAENSDRRGYIRRDSPTLTTAMPLACSVVMFIQELLPLLDTRPDRAALRSRAGPDRLVLLQAPQLVRQLDAPAVDAGLDGPLGQPEAIRNLLVRQLLQVAQHDGGAQRDRQRFERFAELGAQVLVLGLRVGPAGGRRRLQVVRVDVARDRLPLLPHAPVVIDAEVAADADDPGL